MNPSAHPKSAFSLVEVVLAIGVVSFALILLLGLIPIGLKANTDSVQESHVANLVSAVVADRRATPPELDSAMFALPAFKGLTQPREGRIYLRDDGAPLPAGNSAARYRLDYRLVPPPGTATPPLLFLRVSWPALAEPASGSLETLVSLAQ